MVASFVGASRIVARSLRKRTQRGARLLNLVPVQISNSGTEVLPCRLDCLDRAEEHLRYQGRRAQDDFDIDFAALAIAPLCLHSPLRVRDMYPGLALRIILEIAKASSLKSTLPFSYNHPLQDALSTAYLSSRRLTQDAGRGEKY